jgi:hypothetical protein
MAVQHREVAVRRVELVDRDRQYVLVDIGVCLLVEVVADPGPMHEQLSDGHVVGDQRKIRAEQRSRRRIHADHAVLDQAHHRECREGLRTAGDREARGCRVGDPVRPVRHPVGGFQAEVAGPLEADDAREADAFGQLVELASQALSVHCAPRSSPGR